MGRAGQPQARAPAGAGAAGHLRQDKLEIIEDEGQTALGQTFPLLPTGEVSMQLPLTDPDTLFEVSSEKSVAEKPML